MATLVQQPDVANTQISQLRAIETPVAPKAGLSDFIVGLIPVAQQTIGALQEGNKAHNLALGMNDELNNVTREVSWLDRKYYEHGRDVQTIQTGMAARDTEVSQTIYKRLQENPDLAVDDVLREYDEGNKQIVDGIYESDLPLEVKEKLYEAQIQAHAQQVKQVKGVYERVGMEMEVKGRHSRGSSYAAVMLREGTVQDGILALGRLESETRAAYARRTDLDAAQQEEAVQREMKTHIESVAKLLDTVADTGDGTNIQLLDRYESVIDSYLMQEQVTGTSYDALVDVKAKVKSTREAQFKRSEDNVVLEHIERTAMYDAGVEVYDGTAYNDEMTAINNDLVSGRITPATAASLTKSAIDRYARANKALVGAEDEPPNGAQIIANDMSYVEYSNITGKSLTDTTDYNTAVSQTFLTQFANNPEGRVQAAVSIIDWADNRGGKIDNPALRRIGSDLLWNNLTQYLTNPQSFNDPNYARAEEHWSLLTQQYKKYQRDAPTRTDDLLGEGALSDSQRVMMDRVLRDGGSLKRAIQDFQRADEFKGNVDAYRAGVTKWDAKSMGLKSFFGNGSLMGLRHSTAGNLFAVLDNKNAAERDDIIAVTEQTLKSVMGYQSDYELAEAFGVLDGERAVKEGARRGMIIPSRRRFNAAIVNHKAAQTLMRNTTIPEGVRGDYNAIAMDSLIKSHADKYNVETSNVFISTMDKSGNMVYIRHLTPSGTLTEQPVPVHINTVIGIANAAYKAKVSETKNPKVTRVAKGTTQYSGGMFGTTNEKYTYSSGATIGNVTLTAQNSKHKGQKFHAKVPAQAAEMFNGNPQLTMEMINHLGIKEGFHMEIQGVPDSVSGKISHNGALQISLTKNPDWLPKVKAASGNPQALMNVQAEFMAEYFKDLQDVAVGVGIPPARQSQPYPAQHKRTQLYLADLIYHGGNSRPHIKKVKNTLNQGNVRQGMAELIKLPAFVSSGNPEELKKGIYSPRQKFLMQSLLNHYKVKGKV